MKLGEIYYSCWLYLDGCQGEKCHIETEEWHVIKVGPLGANLRQKIEGITWGKLSKKNGDFGFLPNARDRHKKFVPAGESTGKYELFKTKKAASKSSYTVVKQKLTELKRLAARLEKMQDKNPKQR